MKQQQCTYCSKTVHERDGIYIFNEKIYHPACGERVRLRTMNPGSYRILDELRNDVESLYNDDLLVVKHIDEIEIIRQNLSRLIRTP